MRQSWNQSRQVMRLPVQLWKYSCAMIASMLLKSMSVAVAGDASTYLSLKMLRPLFSIAPMLKSGHGDDHEDVEVVFAPEGLLVPAHGALERVHRVVGAALLAVLDVDFQRDLAAGHGGEDVLDHAEVAADQREQVARLGEGIVPHREMAPAGKIAGLDEIAVGEQHRRLGLVRLDAGGEHRHARRAGPENR